MTRRKREEALNSAQRYYEEELAKRYDNLSEQELFERQKRLLAAQMAIREQEAALRKQEDEEFKKPSQEEFISAENTAQTYKSLTFIINPEWGIPSMQRLDGRPRYLVQMRKLSHLCEAPGNLEARRDCVLLYFHDVSFLCVEDFERGRALRLLFPPCDNTRIVTGPSLALDWKAMFSLRFDSLGPLYFECSGESEVRFWTRMYAKS